MQPAPPVDEILGSTLGNFRIVRMLGKGGMGTVYLGEHVIIGSRVAVKFLHAHLVNEHSLIDRFKSEAMAVNQINHENIVNIFDLSYLPPNRWYLVMEYLEGQPLSSMAGSQVPPEVAVNILSQACDALQAAHAARVVHRDLKPENIFLVRRGASEHFVKLVDFGIAKLGTQAAGEGLTGAGLVVGTPEYMAPEQWLGENVDGRADLYALGVIAYLLATGRLPFHEANPLAYYHAHRDKQPEPPRKFNPSLPEAYEAAILRALAKRPEDRYQVAFEMRETLRRSIEGRAATPVPRQPTPVPATTTPPPASPSPVPASPPPQLPARVSGVGFAERTLLTMDLSKAGLFVKTDPPLPPMFSHVKLALLHPQREVGFEADVVRHVDAAQAKGWNLPGSGFAVQFTGLTPATRAVLSLLIAGKELAAAEAMPDDPKSVPALQIWERRLAGDHYALLGMDLDAERSEARARSRKLGAELEALLGRPLSERQKKLIESAKERVTDAAADFVTPSSRAQYDATVGNFRGVARCLGEGLKLKDLAELREIFLSDRPKNAATAQVNAIQANSHLRAGQFAPALDAFEAALALDPLNQELHQSYWTLKRRVAKDREGGR